MENVDYVLKMEEGVLIPVEISGREKFVRNIVCGIAVILVLASILFRENIFMELEWFIQILFILLFFKFIFFGQKKIDTPSQMEIHFYEDYLVLYRPKIYCSKTLTRKEQNIMKYNRITRIKYMKDERQFHIYGQVISKHYKYLKDGSIDRVPHYDRTVDDGFVFFNTRCTSVNDEQVLDILNRYIPNRLEIK